MSLADQLKENACSAPAGNKMPLEQTAIRTITRINIMASSCVGLFSSASFFYAF